MATLLQEAQQQGILKVHLAMLTHRQSLTVPVDEVGYLKHDRERDAEVRSSKTTVGNWRRLDGSKPDLEEETLIHRYDCILQASSLSGDCTLSGLPRVTPCQEVAHCMGCPTPLAGLHELSALLMWLQLSNRSHHCMSNLICLHHCRTYWRCSDHCMREQHCLSHYTSCPTVLHHCMSCPGLLALLHELL